MKKLLNAAVAKVKWAYSVNPTATVVLLGLDATLTLTAVVFVAKLLTGSCH